MTRSMVVSSLLLAMYAFGLAEDCNPTPPTGNPPPQTDPAAGQPQQNPTQPDPSTSAGQNAAGTDPGTAIGGALQLPPWASVFDSGSLPDPTGNDTRVPWASEYWPTYEDSINYHWDPDMPGPGVGAGCGTLTDSVTGGSFFAPDGAGTGSPVSDGGVVTGKAWWEYKYEEAMRAFKVFMNQFEYYRDSYLWLSDPKNGHVWPKEQAEDLRLSRFFWQAAQDSFEEAQGIKRMNSSGQK